MITVPARVAAALAAVAVFVHCGAHRPPLPARTEAVSFQNGGVWLAGTLHLPPGKGPHPAVVVLHASGGPTRDHAAYRHLIERLPSSGFAVLLFDRRGSGESSGDAGTATFHDLAADGVAGIDFLRAQPDLDAGRIGVWGVSQGGWLAALAATLSPHVAFVVAVSAPGVTPAAQMDYAAEYALRHEGHGDEVVRRALAVRAAVNEYYRGRATRESVQPMIESVRSEPWFPSVMLPNRAVLPSEPSAARWFHEMDYGPLAILRRVEVPMLLLFAEDDPWVPVERSMAEISAVTAGRRDVTIRRIPGTGHSMEDAQDRTSAAYIRELLDWLQRAH